MTQSGAEAAGVAAPDVPLLRVVRGEPDAAELAALVAVVSAVGSGDSAAPQARRSAWSDPARTLRSTVPVGGWRASAAPR